jgi:hypothetical protein
MELLLRSRQLEECVYDPYLTIRYDPADRASFCCPDGLWRDWHRRYPTLFDLSDVGRAANQVPNGRLYHEWLTAIRVHELTGYHCLLGKYQLKHKHPEKYAKFVQLVPPQVLKRLPPRGRPLGPDLLMYSKPLDDWFFVEAKGHREPLTESQQELFPKLEKVSKRPIRVVRLKALTKRELANRTP